MVSIPPLSVGSLKDIMSGAEVSLPVIQILGSKLINASGKERYRVLVGDGKYSLNQAMMLRVSIMDSLTNQSIVKLKRYTTSQLKNTDKNVEKGVSSMQILLILDVELLVPGEKVGKIIGDPLTPIYEGKSSSTPSSSISDQPTQQSTSSFNGNRMNSVQMNSSTGGRVCNPIASLSPYHNKWVIKARIANKSDIRTWSNSRGEGKLFSVDLMDESGEIRLTGFRDHVDKFYHLMEVDKVYYISKCQIKPANARYNTLKSEYEMSMTSDTIVELCEDDDGAVPKTHFDFVTLQDVAEKPAGTIVDVIAVCKEASDLDVFTSQKSNRELKKKTVTLVDQSNTSMTLTLWGNQAETFDGSGQPVIAIKGAKVSEFSGGLFLSTVMSSQLKLNPDIPECHRLKGWFDSEGKDAKMTNVSGRTGTFSMASDWRSFKEVQDMGLGKSERGEYYRTLATILLVRTENAVYKACPTAECNKKVVDMQNGMYRCEKCMREFPNFKYRLLVSMNLADFSGNQWVTLFSSEAEKILEKTSQEIGEAFENNPEKGSALLEAVHFQEFIFTCRAKTETYNDEQRLKTVVVKVDPFNVAERNSYLVKSIEDKFGFIA